MYGSSLHGEKIVQSALEITFPDDLGANFVGLLIAALCPSETIGSHGVWNFFLWKKPEVEKFIGNEKPVTGGVPLLWKGHSLSRKQGHGSWRAWFSKSKSLKIIAH